jgi:hypothetical protein
VADSVPADKPKLIQLPPIDKAALAQAAAAQEAALRADRMGGDGRPSRRPRLREAGPAQKPSPGKSKP